MKNCVRKHIYKSKRPTLDKLTKNRKVDGLYDDRKAPRSNVESLFRSPAVGLVLFIFIFIFIQHSPWANCTDHTAPVIKLEMMSGRINIFSILIRISPGKAITMTMSGWIGEATRSNIPDTAPKITPEVQEGVWVSEIAKHMKVKRHFLRVHRLPNGKDLDMINEIMNELWFPSIAVIWSCKAGCLLHTLRARWVGEMKRKPAKSE